MNWLQISFQIQTADLERAEAVLITLGAVSITLDDAGDQPLLEPLPGEMPLWDCCTVSALFVPPVHPEKLETQLRSSLESCKLLHFRTEYLVDQIWEQAWMQDFKPMCFGKRLWVCPSHLESPQPDAINLILDPGLAFGTGTHPTTALCLKWLDAHELKNKTIIDFGCGSGILAIAALLLGARHAYAVDLDSQALQATQANAMNNGVADRLSILHVDNIDKVETADILLANILAGTLIELSNVFYASLAKGGRLIMSGILGEQIETIRYCYAQGFQLQPPVIENNWVLLEGRK